MKFSKLSKKQITIILCSIVIILVGAVIAYAVLQKKEPDKANPANTSIINKDNMEQIQDQLAEKVKKGTFATYMNTRWTFSKSNLTSTDAVMGNSPANIYPFWFEVKLKKNGDVLYKSGVLPVGSKLNKIVLTKKLSKGTYPASVRIHMEDEQGNPVESNVGFNISIIVK